MKKFLKKRLYKIVLKLQNKLLELKHWCETETYCDVTPTNEFCHDCEVRCCCRKANYYLGVIRNF